MNVSACLVTKGDVDMQPVLDSLPPEWERVVWDNNGSCEVYAPGATQVTRVVLDVPDLSVYGRYAAIEHASRELIYVADDDVIVSDPQAITDRWHDALGLEWDVVLGGGVVCNMPPEFRPHYPDAGLVGFGACFHRDAPARAFDRFGAHDFPGMSADDWPDDLFARECDRVFTCLTPRVLVDIPKQDREMASDPDRLWKQPEHHGSTKRMLELARQVRDA